MASMLFSIRSSEVFCLFHSPKSTDYDGKYPAMTEESSHTSNCLPVIVLAECVFYYYSFIGRYVLIGIWTLKTELFIHN